MQAFTVTLHKRPERPMSQQPRATPWVCGTRKIRPKRAKAYHPGLRPGEWRVSARVLKGQNDFLSQGVAPRYTLLPFQGGFCASPSPRALPWAVGSLAFQAAPASEKQRKKTPGDALRRKHRVCARRPPRALTWADGSLAFQVILPPEKQNTHRRKHRACACRPHRALAWAVGSLAFQAALPP